MHYYPNFYLNIYQQAKAVVDELSGYSDSLRKIKSPQFAKVGKPLFVGSPVELLAKLGDMTPEKIAKYKETERTAYVLLGEPVPRNIYVLRRDINGTYKYVEV